MWNLKHITKELIYKTGIDSQTQKTNQRGKEEWEWDTLAVWNKQIHNTIYKIDKQQGPAVQYMGLYSMYYNNL